MKLEFSLTILYLSFFFYLQFVFLSRFCQQDDKKMKKIRLESDSCGYNYMSSALDLHCTLRNWDYFFCATGFKERKIYFLWFVFHACFWRQDKLYCNHTTLPLQFGCSVKKSLEIDCY